MPRLVLPRAPDDDRHAVRRGDDGGDGPPPARPQHRRRRSACASTRSTRFGTKLRALGCGTSSSARSCSARSRRSSTSSRATSSSCVFGDGPKGFRSHWDEFKSGSARQLRPARQRGVRTHAPGERPEGGAASSPTASARRCCASSAAFEPALQALVWARVLGGAPLPELGRAARRGASSTSRRGSSRRSRRWARARRASASRSSARSRTSRRRSAGASSCASRSSSGLLIILAVALPWYVAMYVRHGSPFTDRLIFHDMFKRAFTHVHDTNEGDDTSFRFYVWQLGYALVPVDGPRAARPRRGGCAAATRTTAAAIRRDVGDASVFLVDVVRLRVRALLVHGDEVPPLHLPGRPAGRDAHRRRPRRHARRAAARRSRRRSRSTSAALAVAALAVARAAARRRFGRARSSASPTAARRRPSRHRRSCARRRVVIALGAAIARRRSRARSQRSATSRVPRRASRARDARTRVASHEQLMLGARGRRRRARDRPRRARSRRSKPEGADQPGAIRLLQLFTYNYRRPWPDTLDFSGDRSAASPSSAALARARARACERCAVTRSSRSARSRSSGRVWGLDVYMMKTVAALGSARGHRGLLPRPQGPRRAARRLPDELEGRELLHRQPHPGVRLDRRDVPDVAEGAEGEGREGDVLRHRAQPHGRPARAKSPARATRRSPTRRSATSSSSSAPSYNASMRFASISRGNARRCLRHAQRVSRRRRRRRVDGLAVQRRRQRVRRFVERRHDAARRRSSTRTRTRRSTSSTRRTSRRRSPRSATSIASAARVSPRR